MRPLAFLPFVLFAAVSCSGHQEVGPAPLQGAEHMRVHLVHPPAWRATLDDGEDLLWSFEEDGSCRAWIEGEGRADLHFALTRVAPQGTRAMDASWTADTERLSLTDVRTEGGEALRDMGFPLGWVDGKLRIEIAGRRFIKRLD